LCQRQRRRYAVACRLSAWQSGSHVVRARDRLLGGGSPVAGMSNQIRHPKQDAYHLRGEMSGPVKAIWCWWSPLGRWCVRNSALRRRGIVAVSVATPDLTVLLVDDVLGPLTPRRFASGGLRSRLCGKDLAYPGSTFAAVGPAAAVGDGVNGRLLRHGEPLLENGSDAEILPRRRAFRLDHRADNALALTRVSTHRPFG
jgi:hypothetical protein